MLDSVPLVCITGQVGSKSLGTDAFQETDITGVTLPITKHNYLVHDVEELGCRVLHQWATLGEFDFVNVVEAPDIATVARVSVALGARGSTRIETLPALEVEDFLRALE